MPRRCSGLPVPPAPRPNSNIIFKRFNIPKGLKDVGFSEADIPKRVEGTLPQHRVTKLSPRPAGEKELAALFRDAMQYW